MDVKQHSTNQLYNPRPALWFLWTLSTMFIDFIWPHLHTPFPPSSSRPQQAFRFLWTLSTLLSCCFTSTEARWPIRDVDRVGRGRQSEGSTAETVRKRPERPWTAARIMEVLRRCPLAIAQRPVHSAVAVSTAVLDRVTKTMSVATLLTNNLDNSKQKTSNLLSPVPPPSSWSLLGNC